MTCKCQHKPKHVAYGQRRTRHWCDSCDKNLVVPIRKGSERQRAKREIANAPREPEYDPREYVPPETNMEAGETLVKCEKCGALIRPNALCPICYLKEQMRKMKK